MKQATDITVFSELENDILDAWNLIVKLNTIHPHPAQFAESELKHKQLLESVQEWKREARTRNV